MPAQELINRAISVLNGPVGLIVLGVFVVLCIAMLRMDSNHR